MVEGRSDEQRKRKHFSSKNILNSVIGYLYKKLNNKHSLMSAFFVEVYITVDRIRKDIWN